MARRYIYGLLRDDTVVYVGQTANLQQRWNAHRNYWQSWIDDITVLDIIDGDLQDALDWERWWQTALYCPNGTPMSSRGITGALQGPPPRSPTVLGPSGHVWFSPERKPMRQATKVRDGWVIEKW